MIAETLLSIGIGGAVLLANDVFPEVGDFRLQKIHKAAGEVDWPFVADGGTLLCARVMHEPAVYFVPDVGGEPGRPYVIDSDITKMAFANLGTTGILKPYESFEQLLKRIFPYVAIGKRLCDQPPGTDVPGSEL
jgi:hypothetical protein